MRGKTHRFKKDTSNLFFIVDAPRPRQPRFCAERTLFLRRDKNRAGNTLVAAVGMSTGNELVLPEKFFAGD